MNRTLPFFALAWLCAAACGDDTPGTPHDATVDALHDAAPSELPATACFWDLWSLRDKPCNNPGEKCFVWFDFDSITCLCDQTSMKWSCEWKTAAFPDLRRLDMSAPTD